MGTIVDILVLFMYLAVISFIAGYVVFAGLSMAGYDPNAPLCLLTASLVVTVAGIVRSLDGDTG